MTEVIEFPAAGAEVDFMPQPGNRYQAYALYDESKTPMLAFVFPDWSMTALPYDQLKRFDFRLLGEDADRDGNAVIEMTFGSVKGIYEVVITGHNIFGLCFNLGDHTVTWIWELPKNRAAVTDGKPVVHSIDIREQARS